MLFNYINYKHDYSDRVVISEDSNTLICYKAILDLLEIENSTVILIARVLADAVMFWNDFMA